MLHSGDEDDDMDFDAPKIYEPVESLDQLASRLKSFQEQYNETVRGGKMDLVFFKVMNALRERETTSNLCHATMLRVNFAGRQRLVLPERDWTFASGVMLVKVTLAIRMLDLPPRLGIFGFFSHVVSVCKECNHHHVGKFAHSCSSWQIGSPPPPPKGKQKHVIAWPEHSSAA